MKIFIFLGVLWFSIITATNFFRPSKIWERYRRAVLSYERRERIRRIKTRASEKIRKEATARDRSIDRAFEKCKRGDSE